MESNHMMTEATEKEFLNFSPPHVRMRLFTLRRAGLVFASHLSIFIIFRSPIVRIASYFWAPRDKGRRTFARR